MTVPTITPQINGYRLAWGEERIIVSVSRLRLHTSDGRVTGEITIEAVNDGKPIRVFPPTDFNFTSEVTRTRLAKNLATKFAGSIDWALMLDQLCEGVVERARQGEPVQELWTSDDVPDLVYLLHPILIRGVPTIVFGEKGVAKSTLSQICYLILSLPWHDNPLGLGAPPEPVRTLVLDYELPGEIAQRNMKRLQEGMDLPPVLLYHRRCFAPLVDDIEQVANHVAAVKAEVVIIDSLAGACGGDLIKTEPANRFYEALGKLKVTSLILAQTSKDLEGKRKTVYGNALFTYYARSIFELCRSDFSADGLSVGLFHRWANLTRLHDSMGFRLSFNGTHTTVEREPVNIIEFKDKINKRDAVLGVLKRGALSFPALEAELGGGGSSALRVLLSRMKQQGLVTNPEHGTWGLADRPKSNVT